jgi:cyclopropane fatty-acyl-phospholipid synthase-like methyltransferase
MKEFWNSRYAQENYVYGTEPNVFFKQNLDALQPSGSILLPAEGEGRNAVYAAKKGLQVEAFDLSDAGQQKALQLAAHNGVSINYQVGEFSSFDFGENRFDVVALVFAHFPSRHKSDYHRRLVQYLKPGGLFIIEAFSKNHLEYSAKNPAVGGPRDLDLLLSIEDIQQDFDQLQPIYLKEEVIELNEGSFHKGTGSVVRFVGRKPE